MFVDLLNRNELADTLLLLNPFLTPSNTTMLRTWAPAGGLRVAGPGMTHWAEGYPGGNVLLFQQQLVAIGDRVLWKAVGG